MALFEYDGFDKAGGRASGTIEAPTIDLARSELKKQQIMLKTLRPKKNVVVTSSLTSQRISLSDLHFFTSELSLLLQAGLKIDKGIDLLRKTTKKTGLQYLLGRIAQSMKSGKQLSEALSDFPDYFDPLYINLVSIGEATGNLSNVFKQLSEDLAFKSELRRRIIQALTYPAVIVLVCVASILFIFNYVVPNMAGMFEQQSELPVYTRFLLTGSEWLQNYQFGLFFVVGMMLFGGYMLRRHPLMKEGMQAISCRLPLLKSALLLVERVRFNSGLSMMLKAGVAIDNAMTLASGNIRQKSIREEITIAIGKVKRGESLSASLSQSRLYPDFFSSLLAVGEESGDLPSIFSEIAQRSQKQFSDWVTRFTSLLEPLLILLMGGIVGSVVVIMMLSITSVTDVGL